MGSTTNNRKTKIKNLFNATIIHKHQPLDWKQAIIILIPKPGKDHSHPSGYRPISLMQVLAKLLEKIMCARLRIAIENAKHVSNGKPYLPDEQSGFRNYRQMNDNIYRFFQMTTRAAQNNNDHTIAISLDR